MKKMKKLLRSRKQLDYEQIKKALKQNNFNFIKLEFEANVDDMEEDENCEYCEEGHVECYDCDGSGEVSIVNAQGDEISSTTCPSCNGDGTQTCEECNGHWQGDSGLGRFQDKFIKNFPKGFKTEYIKTYCDGSVNTEVTMTFSVDMLDKVEDVIKGFTKTCESYGEWDTEGAGFHISILEDSKYPALQELPSKKINNFLKAMNVLTDAMYYLATEDGKKTRKSEYRSPRASMCDKYSAIYTHSNTCIEYRVFDVCYLKPERMLGFMNVIVRTLKFYSEKHILTEQWKNKQLFNHIDRYVNVDEICDFGRYKDLIFDKLTYLYSDKDKLKTISDSVKKGIISDKTALSRITN